MPTILESIGDYLQNTSSAFGAHASQGTLGTNLFLATLPESPDVCTAVYENSGTPPAFTMGTGGIVIDYPMLQIISRATKEDYPTARDKIEVIRNLLASITDVTISGVHVLRIEPMGSVNPLGIDPKQRPLLSANFRCLVRK
jgi:hypothetical protein